MRPLPCRPLPCCHVALPRGPVDHASALLTPCRPAPAPFAPTRRSKAKVSKKGDKVIVTLKKLHKTNWGQLRMNVCLPYRRGGGGS